MYTAMMRRFAIAPLAVIVLAFVGCGGSSSGGDQAGFAWLQPGPPPAGWKLAPLRDGTATMAYPPSWHRDVSDPGTVTAVLESKSAPLAGYLNATPQQGGETFDNWADFRVRHNAGEGDHNVHAVASATGLDFRDGAKGSCVIDTYTTESGHPYKEIACLVGSQKATNVIVGAAPPSLWHRVGPQIERAVSTFST
jgi:hypothetical protein